MQEYEWEEISKHCKSSDCWIVAHNKVYNVTDFIENHPAGIGTIVKKAGTDCTIDFDFHSKNTQKKIWDKYIIGKVKGTSYTYCSIL